MLTHKHAAAVQLLCKSIQFQWIFINLTLVYKQVFLYMVFFFYLGFIMTGQKVYVRGNGFHETQTQVMCNGKQTLKQIGPEISTRSKLTDICILTLTFKV